MYDPTQKAEIRQLTRQAVGAALAGKRMTRPADCTPFLLEPRGCFVTLHHGHDLRGCIGTFEARHPLIDTIIEMAGASTRDPRFVGNRVTLDELNQLTIEVSILTPLEPLDDPLDLRLGVDGIYIIDHSSGGMSRSGCFLPQVAPEQGWNVEQTLSFCCSHKMGLDPDAWRGKCDLRFFRFQAIVISEEDVT